MIHDAIAVGKPGDDMDIFTMMTSVIMGMVTTVIVIVTA
jgi:hypothetical protein